MRTRTLASISLLVFLALTLLIPSPAALAQNALIFSGGSIFANCASDCVQLSDLTNAQTFRIFGTATGPKYLSLSHNGTNGIIDTAASSGNITIGGVNASGITLGASSINTTIAGNGIISGGVSVAGSIALNSPTTQTGATYTIATTDNFEIVNLAGTQTITLPAAASFTGRILFIRTIQAQTVVSAASNVVPLIGGAAGTAILAATAGKWAMLVSDGSNWQITAAN